MLWGLLFIPSYIAIGFTFNPRRIVAGANDNLSGCLLGITILREMEKQGIELENTEVGVILTGSEEAGLRGSKAWCRAHQKDYQDVPTYIVCMDTIHSPEHLMVNEKDLNGMVALDADLTDAFMRAAIEVGVPCRKGRIPLMGGATDGAGFAQGGFRSASVTGMSHRLENYYHTRRDLPDSLNPEGLENCYKAAVRLFEMIDSKELDKH
jgi:putative aminopeptidase FrvX